MKKNLFLFELIRIPAVAWLICVIAVIALIGIATKGFTGTIQETTFGASNYFIFLFLGFTLLGFLSFGLAVLIIFIHLIRNNKVKNLIRSPIFIFSAIILLFIIGLWVTKTITPFADHSIEQQYQPANLIKQQEPKIIPDEVFELTNNERTKNGLKPFKRNPKLDQAALERAKIIIEYNEWAHEATKSGVPYTKAINKANYWNINYGENLANGQYTSEEVVNGWMSSDTHRRNILDTKFQEIGIATYSGKLNGLTTIVTVQLFGGYQPPNYRKEDIDSWRNAVNNLNSIIPSWEKVIGWNNMNQEDLRRLLDLLYRERTIASNILGKMETNKWLTKQEENSINEYNSLANESTALANKLNGR